MHVGEFPASNGVKGLPTCYDSNENEVLNFFLEGAFLRLSYWINHIIQEVRCSARHCFISNKISAIRIQNPSLKLSSDRTTNDIH
jgi:hypothetical protein